ncbi:LAQU0S07e02212g1_1 [Lachancea quebecensis]|uniref:LAQU0S07e02212g1_1 n=1 Tax=Lachancea quebecensis TaxID=1654605 RepID=A0A0P1KSM5_9SACH|nr:LAQU0S07e02212g1_1 [Lachancea quebecensis]
MSRVRKFNRDVLSKIRSDSDTDEDIPLHPMDIEEQEELISKLEFKNLSSNNQNIQLLSIAYVVCCGVFLSLVMKVRKIRGDTSMYKRLLLYSVNSIICSLLNLRYDLIKDFAVSNAIKVRITSRRINIINCILLLLLTWEVTGKVDTILLQLLFHVPLLLFCLSVISKKWIFDLDEELNGLRGLKYKFKNA